MRAFVTGMGGFVGAHLAARLAGDGWEVTGTVRPGGSGRHRLEGVGAHPIPVDLADADATAHATATADPDVVFLLAAARAATTAAERAATAAVNATSVGSVLRALTPRCRTVVRLGSSTEYAATDGPMDESTPVRPRGFFGETKAAGTAVLQRAAPPPRTAILRAFQIYGPADHPHRLVPTALRAARTGATLPLTQPGLRRDWIYVDDVVEACVRAATADHLPHAQVLNIGTGSQHTNEELVELVGEVTGRPVAVEVGAHPGCPWDTASWVSDPSLARDLLGWEAKVTLDEGLRRCWEAGLR